MIVNLSRNNQPDVHTVAEIKIVKNFNYLGSTITNAGSCDTDIRHRLAIARDTTPTYADLKQSPETPNVLVFLLPRTVQKHGSQRRLINTKCIRDVGIFIAVINSLAHRTTASIINPDILVIPQDRRHTSMQRLMIEGKVEENRTRQRYLDQIYCGQ